MKMSKGIPLLILVMFFGSIMAGVIGMRGRPSNPGIVLHRGQVIPKFEVMTQEGELISRQSLLGRRHLIAFFNVECEHCTREIPKWDRILSHYPAETLTAIAISESELFKTQEFVRQCSPRIRYIIDKEDGLKKVFKVRALPTVFLVDTEGRVQNTLIGEHEAESSQKILEEFLRRTEVGLKPEGLWKIQSTDPITNNRSSTRCEAP